MTRAEECPHHFIYRGHTLGTHGDRTPIAVSMFCDLCWKVERFLRDDLVAFPGTLGEAEMKHG